MKSSRNNKKSAKAVRRKRVGLWMIGACGGIGSTVSLGLAALKKGLCAPVGMVTSLADFASLDLVDPADIVVGGHEVRRATLYQAVTESHREAGLFSRSLIDDCAPELRAYQRNIRPGTIHGSSRPVAAMADEGAYERERTPVEAIERIAADISSFHSRHRLERTVVVHVASAEPAPRRRPTGSHDAILKKLNGSGALRLPSSTLYALAAIRAGCPYVNFTPSMGMSIPGLERHAAESGLAYMGSDGKTGESLVKSFLAPMFACRNLNVLSWVGQNILGNRDGEVLSDPATREAKIRSKDGLLASLDAAGTARHVSIDYVPSLRDWKVAWDFIHFEGFLGTRMNLQFTWYGSDSILAAPLVIDLCRLADHAGRIGFTGPMRHLACFFKSPTGVTVHDYPSQWRMLLDYVERARAGTVEGGTSA